MYLLNTFKGDNMSDISKIDIGRINDLVDKLNEINTKFDNINSKLNSMKYVVESGSNDNGWYRKWNDGWIEQGQDFPNNVPSGTEVFFPLSFSNTDYVIIVSGSNSYNYYISNSKTINSVKIGSNASGPRSYYACGY